MNTTQSGRSMLEMLAVLCVIGVLTVGVLLGYRQGMIRYKTYRTYVEISEMVEGIYRVCGLFGGLNDCSGQRHNIGHDLEEAGVIQAGLTNPFGNPYNVNLGANSDIQTDVDDNDVCAELVAEDWPAGVIVDAADGQPSHCNGHVLVISLDNLD